MNDVDTTIWTLLIDERLQYVIGHKGEGRTQDPLQGRLHDLFVFLPAERERIDVGDLSRQRLEIGLSLLLGGIVFGLRSAKQHRPYLQLPRRDRRRRRRQLEIKLQGPARRSLGAVHQILLAFATNEE